METAGESIPDMALDDIIKSKKQERRKERGDNRGRGGFRGRGRGRPFSRGRGGPHQGQRPYRERSRERDYDRRRYSDEYSDYSRSPSRREEEERSRPKKRIIIKRAGDSHPEPHSHSQPHEAPAKRVSHSVTEGFNPNNTIQIRNFPTEINMKDMITLFKDFGTIRNLSVNWSKKKDSQCTVYVEFSSHKEAARAKDKYNNADMEGFTLKISFLEDHS